MSNNRIITLVSYLVAKEGYTFVFSGPMPECSTCRFKKVCVDRLKKNHVYKIVKVLRIRNRCPVNKYVVTVEVEEVPITVVVPKRLAIDGMIINYEKIKCDNRSCPYYNFCRPKLLPERSRVKIVKVLDRVKCPRGMSLIKVDVIPM